MFENNNFYALNTVTTGSVEDNRDPITSKITVQLVEGETGKKEVHRNRHYTLGYSKQDLENSQKYNMLHLA